MKDQMLYVSYELLVTLACLFAPNANCTSGLGKIWQTNNTCSIAHCLFFYHIYFEQNMLMATRHLDAVSW